MAPPTESESTRLAFDLIPTPCLILGFDGNIAAANVAVRTLLGSQSSQELIGRSLLDFIHPEDWDDFLLTFKESVAFSGQEHRIGVRLFGVSSAQRHVEMQWVASTDRPECYCGLRDVTDERRRDHHLRRITDGLQEAERTASIGSWELDCEQNELYWSPETRRLHGVPPDFVPTSESAIAFFDEDSRETIRGALECCMQSGTPYDLVAGFHDFEGTHLWVRCIGLPRYEHERVSSVHGVIQDVTRQRQSELELGRAKAAAEEASRARSTFLSSMSHEIRTPLNGVIGLAKLLLLSDPREDQRSDLEAMTFAAEHLLSLLNDVLDISKLEADRVEIEQIDFSLTHLLGGLEASFAPRAREKEIGFSVEVSQDVPRELRGDPTRLLQILTNIVGNAIKFTAAGGVRLEVAFEEETGAGVGTNADAGSVELRFAIVDSGVGMTTEEQEKLFQEFSQASASTTRNYGGTGLGLLISRGLVERMGSQLLVESAPGRGSRFQFTLSLGRAESVGHVVDSSGDGGDSLEGVRVLLAEDNSLNVKVAKRFLERWGCIVTVAEDGVLAIERLEVESFDLALLDLHMPGKGGIDVAKWVRASEDPSLRALPLLALTAATTSEERRATEEVGMNGFVPKPFAPTELRNALLTALGTRVCPTASTEERAA